MPRYDLNIGDFMPDPASLPEFRVEDMFPGVEKSTITLRGDSFKRFRYPDVRIQTDDPRMRVGEVVQYGPDAHLVADWRPGDEPLAVQPYRCVEETEPGVFRLEWVDEREH